MRRAEVLAVSRQARLQRERRALISARLLVDRMTRHYRELERRTGAPIALHRVLACIDAQPGIPASGLAETLGMRRPAVSHVLKALVERGWVERVRRPEDQRSIRVSLTGAGRRLIGATSGKAAGTLQRGIRQLSTSELEGLATGLTALLQHLPEARRPPSPVHPAGRRRAG
jgi:DNA-binding MarR family transcriptional regulator